MERRKHTRKLLDPIHVTDMKAVDRFVTLARYGTILNASATGLLIGVSRHDLNPDMLQTQLSLDAIEGEHVMMKIVEMDLELDGRIVRAHPTDSAYFEIAVDFTKAAPPYWRECLAELLPGLGEIPPAGPSSAVEVPVDEMGQGCLE